MIPQQQLVYGLARPADESMFRGTDNQTSGQTMGKGENGIW